MGSKDAHLDWILSKIENIDEMLTKKAGMPIHTLTKALAPTLRTSNIKVYDSDTNSIEGDVVYELLSPAINHMKTTEFNIPEVYSVASFIKNSALWMSNLNAHGVSANDSSSGGSFSGRAIVGVDAICDFQVPYGIDVSLKTSRDKHEEFKKIEKIVSNFYSYGNAVKGMSLFFSFDKNLSEGYLMTVNEAYDPNMSLEKMLDRSMDESKVKKPLFVPNSSTIRVYAVSRGGDVKRHLTGKDETNIAKWLTNIQNSIFIAVPTIKSYSVFLNGQPVEAESFFKDVKETTCASGIAYLNSVNPRIDRGVVEYSSPSGDISEEEGAFLERIKPLYNGSLEEARRALRRKNVVEESSMFG